VWPPDGVVAAIAALERPVLEGVRWTAPDQWHVTLRFLGELADPLAAVDAGEGERGPVHPADTSPAAAVAARLRTTALPAAEAVMGPASQRRPPGLLWLPVTGLDALAGAVADATSGIGTPVRVPFRGHVTLARARRSARPGVLGAVAPLACTATWEAREVTVVQSTLGGSGSRYDVLDRVGIGP